MFVIQIVGGTQVRTEEPVGTIGSDPASLVAVPRDAHLAPQHAVIRQVGGRWVIESQGEGLIRIGSGVPTKLGWLSRGDSIKLSETGPELLFESLATGTPADRPPPLANRAPNYPEVGSKP